jgi:trimethylamine:corrinoid methyltransferase-like protein
MRSEYFYGNGVTNRSQREKWLSDGGQDARAKAREIALGMLSSAQPALIPEEVDQMIRGKYPIAI